MTVLPSVAYMLRLRTPQSGLVQGIFVPPRLLAAASLLGPGRCISDWRPIETRRRDVPAQPRKYRYLRCSDFGLDWFIWMRSWSRSAVGSDSDGANTGVGFGFAPTASIIVVCVRSGAVMMANARERRIFPLRCRRPIIGGDHHIAEQSTPACEFEPDHTQSRLVNWIRTGFWSVL